MRSLLSFLALASASYDIESPYGLEDNVPSKLSENGTFFSYEGENLRIISGSLHYFRIPREYWRDRMIKLKALGANTLQMYIAWNAHEKVTGQYDFSGNLDVAHFLTLAKQEGFHVTLRPGPFICAEWELGGLPAWLLKDPEMKFRDQYEPYQAHVTRWFDRVYQEVLPFMDTTGNGPIFLIQIENEYATYFPAKYKLEHLEWLNNLTRSYGVLEKTFTSDSGNIMWPKGGFNKHLKSINLDSTSDDIKFDYHENQQGDRPLFVSEYWAGWFDQWNKPHQTRTVEKFSRNLRQILDFNDGSSVNFYMFHGGTSWGFMNGATSEIAYRDKYTTIHDTTSYDYDCLCSENGKLTEKFYRGREIIHRHTGNPKPSMARALAHKVDLVTYDTPVFTGYLTLWDATYINLQVSDYRKLYMESLEYKLGADNVYYGQNYGYTAYEANVWDTESENITLSNVHVRDFARIFAVDSNNDFSEITWIKGNDGIQTISFPNNDVVKVVVLVENAGRVNIGDFMTNQRKGLHDRFKINDKYATLYQVMPLEFDKEMMGKVSDNIVASNETSFSTGFFEFQVEINSIDGDTYIQLPGFEKGLLFVNGIHIGRYWNSAGPQLSFYIPKYWLNQGVNEIIVFEETSVEMTGNMIEFVNDIVYGKS